MKRIYIAGPMTGIPEFNYPAFNAETKRLRALGYHVENPAENPTCDGWADYMRAAITQLVSCNAIVLLPKWDTSKGAKLEYHIAMELGIKWHRVGALRGDSE